MRAARGASHRAGLSSPRLPASPLLRRGLGVRRGPRCCPGGFAAAGARDGGWGEAGGGVGAAGGRWAQGVCRTAGERPSGPRAPLPPCVPDRDPKFSVGGGRSPSPAAFFPLFSALLRRAVLLLV